MAKIAVPNHAAVAALETVPALHSRGLVPKSLELFAMGMWKQ